MSCSGFEDPASTKQELWLLYFSPTHMRFPLLLTVLACAVACGPTDARRQLGAGAVVPDLVAAELSGDTVSLQSLRGNVVLLNLWATWCAPCRQETPFLQSKYEEYRSRGFEVVGVSMDNRGAKETIEQFVQEYGVTYTILHDPMQMGLTSYRAIGLPATFLINRDGTLRWFLYGPVTEENELFVTAIEDALRLTDSLP
jgi:peroxiredoxin